jgi:hypothetical protein
MATKELARFWLEYLPQHPEVRTTLETIGDANEFARATVEAGVGAGFDFSEGDVKSVMGPPVANELSDAQLAGVAGGRAGGDPVKYMEFKLKEVLISGVIP